MTSWNESYFERLRDWVQRIEDRGMYCSVMMFGSFNGMRSAFENTAWHRSNNVNPALDDFSNATDFFTTDEPDIRRWVWQTFTRGKHPIFMDPYDDDRSGCGCSAGCNDGAIDPRWDTVRTSLGDTVVFAQRFSDLAAMIPSTAPEDCSTSYCLRGDGAREFLVYQPEGGAFDVEVPEGEYSYEWFDPNGTGSFADRIVETGTTDGGTTRFVPPFDGEAVLYLSGQ